MAVDMVDEDKTGYIRGIKWKTTKMTREEITW